MRCWFCGRLGRWWQEHQRRMCCDICDVQWTVTKKEAA